MLLRTLGTGLRIAGALGWAVAETLLPAISAAGGRENVRANVAASVGAHVFAVAPAGGRPAPGGNTQQHATVAQCAFQKQIGAYPLLAKSRAKGDKHFGANCGGRRVEGGGETPPNMGASVSDKDTASSCFTGAGLARRVGATKSKKCCRCFARWSRHKSGRSQRCGNS